MEKINQIVDNFLDENLVNDELELTKQLYEFDHQVVQRIIYNYFKKINKEHLLINRSNKTIVEITKTLISSKKNFW
ncbi:Uncharacterised protein, partial [Mycoplasma putrefaciens]